jgi:hypothetical protein
MSSTVTQLADFLRKTRRPGDFYARGKGGLLPPSLSVQGVGPIALPLLPTLICTKNQASYTPTHWGSVRSLLRITSIATLVPL